MTPSDTSSRGWIMEQGIEPMVKSSARTSFLCAFIISFPSFSCPRLAVSKEQLDKKGLRRESWDRKSFVSRFKRAPFPTRIPPRGVLL
jgi:hypothetical protein